MSEQTTNLGWEGIIPHLLKAQQGIESVGKESRNNFNNFNYTSAETMITDCRVALHNQGLIVTRNGWRIIREPDCTPTVEAVYVLGHNDGHSVVCATQYPIVIKGGAMPEDKALNASLTTGLNYFLRDLLLVPRVEVEVCSRPDSTTSTAKSGTRQTKVPTSAAKKRSKDFKSEFMASVGRWINRDLNEKIVATTCISILERNDLPTDGKATNTQFEDMHKWVESQIKDGIDAADYITE
jgi:hypothetical protein